MKTGSAIEITGGEHKGKEAIFVDSSDKGRTTIKLVGPPIVVKSVNVRSKITRRKDAVSRKLEAKIAKHELDAAEIKRVSEMTGATEVEVVNIMIEERGVA